MQINPSSTGQRMTSLYSIRFLQSMLRLINHFHGINTKEFFKPFKLCIELYEKKKKTKENKTKLSLLLISVLSSLYLEFNMVNCI